MPKDLWDAAVKVSREHGVWAVSRALRLNYGSLRTRLEAQAPSKSAGACETSGFVELDATAVLSATAPATAVLELSRADGARMTIRLEGRGVLDLPSLAAAFLGGKE